MATYDRATGSNRHQPIDPRVLGVFYGQGDRAGGLGGARSGRGFRCSSPAARLSARGAVEYQLTALGGLRLRALADRCAYRRDGVGDAFGQCVLECLAGQVSGVVGVGDVTHFDAHCRHPRQA